jgi:hypothetical protein
VTETLGNSDAFLLNEIVYVPLRLLGAEPLLAITLAAVVLSAMAFFFVYLLLRRFDVSVPLASLAALIFTFPNNLYLESFHPQCFAVYYIPLIAYCGLLAVTELHQRPVRAYLLGAFTAGMYGVLFSTAYYIAWFFWAGLADFYADCRLHGVAAIADLVAPKSAARARTRARGEPRLYCRAFDIPDYLCARLGDRCQAQFR